MAGSTAGSRGRADLHFHLLPGVDDGPKTEEESIELARLALADGTSTIVATPHVRDLSRLDEVPARLSRLGERLDREGVPVEVLAGGELAQEDVLSGDLREYDLIAQGPAEARWLLLEAPLFAAPLEGLHAAADELRARGFAVVLAHPERCDDLFEEDRQPLRRELDRGARLLLNATSLTGLHGERARQFALGLLSDGTATAVASDAHRPSRGPALSAALSAAIAAGVDAVAARAAVEAAPRELLTGGLRRGDAFPCGQ